jgi:Trypsin
VRDIVGLGAADCGCIEGTSPNQIRWWARGLSVLVALGLILLLVPAAGASSGRPMRFKVTKAQLRHAKLHHGYLRLAHELRNRTHRARVAIVGGSEISIEGAPWQVIIESFIPDGPETVLVLICGGSTLNESEILTAGHCVIDPLTGTQVPADEIVVGAGISNLAIKAPEEQASLASGVRVHPYYNPDATPPAPDDVAVLKLEKPFLLTGPAAKSVALISAGSLLQEGTAINLTGFGVENPLSEELNGTLNSIGMDLVSSQECGGEVNAVFLCASTSKGALCFGDSGSALILPGSPATQAGVADTTEVSAGKCFDGGLGGFANVAAPEIRDFIVGDSPDPPTAPRGGGASLLGAPASGDTLSCERGSWSGLPTFTYTFVNTVGGQVLQHGTSSTYPLTGADIGRTIDCLVAATNEGGTGIDQTSAVGPIRPTLAEEAALRKAAEESVQKAAAERKRAEEEAVAAALALAQKNGGAQGVAGIQEGAPAPVPDAKLASTALAASASGAVTIKVSCPAAESSCSGTVMLRTLDAVSAGAARAARSKKAILTLASGSFTVAGGFVKTITLHLSAKARALLSRSQTLRVRATIVAHDPSGAAHTTKTVATLRAPKTKHRKG